MSLDQIPADLRLCHAVAVLLQGHTFALSGLELECQLAELLCIGDQKKHLRDAALRDLLNLQTGKPNISEYVEADTKQLVRRALRYKEDVLQGVQEGMAAKYGPGSNAFAAISEKHGKVREGIIALIDTALQPMPVTGTGATSWAPALQGLELQGVAARVGTQGILQLLAAAMEQTSPQPLTVVAMRLACMPLNTLADLRYRLVRKYKTFANMASVKGISTLDKPCSMSQSTFTQEYVSLQCSSADDPELREKCAKEARMVFEAFDASGEGILDGVELQLALSAAAPGASLERLRICVLLKFGTWKHALSSLDLTAEDLAAPSALTAIAAPLDIPYEDIQVIYNHLDEDGDGKLTWQELTNALNIRAEGFSLEELTLRAWSACESGKLMTQQAEQRLPRNHAADMPLAQDAFASKVFGVQVSSQAIQEGGRRRCTVTGRGSFPLSLTTPQDLATSLKSKMRPPSAQGSSTNAKPLLPTQPVLTEAEVLHAYTALWSKHSRVTMNLLLAELKTHTFVSDVLALDRGQLHPGDTVVVKYRVPRQMEAQLNDMPFVAAVPQRMVWSPAGGGCWRLNGTEYTEIAGPRMVLPSKTQGVVQVQIPEMSALDNEPLEFRLFSSPDGRKPGKQVGAGARFVLRQVPPARPHVVSAATTPTSVKLLWEPPPANRGSGTSTMENRSFMVRGWPLDLNVAEMTPAMAATSAWSHRNQEITGLCSYDVDNLVPGATYRFEVSEIRRDGEAAADDAEKGTEGKEGPPSNALQITLPLWSAPLPPGRPQFVSKGQAGERVLRWQAQVEQDASLRSEAAPTLKYKLFWDIPPANATAASNTRMVVQRGSLSFWPFPGTCWLRELEETAGGQDRHRPGY